MALNSRRNRLALLLTNPPHEAAFWLILLGWAIFWLICLLISYLGIRLIRRGLA